MGRFSLVVCCIVGLVIVSRVMPMDISSFDIHPQFTTTSQSSTPTVINRQVRQNRDEDDDKDDDKHDKPHSGGGRDDDDDDEKPGGERGASRALRLLRQHRATTEKEDSATTKRPRERDENSRHERQVPADADFGAPGAPGAPEAAAAAQPPAVAAFPPPRPAPRPPPPPPAGGGPSSLTLPDGADIVVGPIIPGFSCQSRTYGYYADTLNACKLFHVCVPVTDENGVTNPIQWSFFCGNQTLFNQEKLVCDHEINVDCSKSENFYSINDNFGKIGAPQAIP